MISPRGYAVIDTETTGLATGWHHRVVEIAVIHLDPDGTVTDEWCTLLNPGRDLGRQDIHGIRAADVRHAPRFDQIAGDLVERLRGRLVAAHNWPFDAGHVRAEFDRIGIDAPVLPEAGLCTMRAAGAAMPWAPRSLRECCAAAGLPERDWHSARDDALAAAGLLAHLIARAPEVVQPTPDQYRFVSRSWPRLPLGVVAPVRRTPVGRKEPHFLARLVERLPRDEEPRVDAYFSLLDEALLDRRISGSEADALVELACSLGMDKGDVVAVHHSYLRELARAAWADGTVTDAERSDLDTVATLLGLNDRVAATVLDEERPTGAGGSDARAEVTVGGLNLRPGDRIVLTGEMRHGRHVLTERAEACGLRVTGSVSGRTRVLVAADPDSQSTKARRAHALGVPIVDEHALVRALDSMPSATPGKSDGTTRRVATAPQGVEP
ncbi:exonuclease domain-containing protein [Saccharomonospora iraqiensis]|uniref:exonuclease domain-containing protein n=1 Tax=Saccharomonospora iraqiensis TaxID=52698 RepID=UPI00040C93D0|nr:exonuclease domain-containing protein [Saccharomonospora iraqiensis]